MATPGIHPATGTCVADTEEVTGSIPVSPTSVSAGQRLFPGRRADSVPNASPTRLVSNAIRVGGSGHQSQVTPRLLVRRLVVYGPGHELGVGPGDPQPLGLVGSLFGVQVMQQ